MSGNRLLKKKLIWFFFETPSNPCLELIDIENVCKIANKSGALTIVDNVFATPILQKPLKFGADIVMYSATKHIDGQGRVLGGAILGSKKFCTKFIKPFIRNTGPSISPFNAWILLKGIETLELRVKKQTENAKKIVDFLNNNNRISKVIYPKDHQFEQLELANKQMIDGGSIISFKLKTKTKNKKKGNI